MKIAILIQAHKNPEQVGRLCRALSHPDIDLYLNIDHKCDIQPFLDTVPDNAQWIKQRTEIRWGDFSQVAATLRGLREIVGSGRTYDYVIFVSGQDYPILPAEEIVSQIEQRAGSEMIAWIELPPDHPWNRRYRYRHYHFNNKICTLAVNRMIRTLSFRLRTYPLQPVYKGSQWWNLSIAAIRYILDYCRIHPEFIRFNRTVHCSDELFFQTLLLHSPFRERLLNDNFRYIDWSTGSTSPRTLTVNDFDKIVQSGKWFARKLDMQQDSLIFDQLDEFRTLRENQHNDPHTGK